MALTAPERETVILMDDDCETATVTTWQRKWITKLKNNPAAELVQEFKSGTTSGAEFRVPAEFVTVRTKRRSRPDLAAANRKG